MWLWSTAGGQCCRLHNRRLGLLSAELLCDCHTWSTGGEKVVNKGQRAAAANARITRRKAEFTRLSPADRWGHHKLPEWAWTALRPPRRSPSFYLQISEETHTKWYLDEVFQPMLLSICEKLIVLWTQDLLLAEKMAIKHLWLEFSYIVYYLGPLCVDISFNSATLESFQAWLASLRSCLISIHFFVSF